MSTGTSTFICVHAGAGYHNPETHAKLKSLVRTACTDALTFALPPLQTVVAATTILEDHPLTNAGTGSNLAINGSVECDASIMDSQTGGFGAVGSLKGCKNPIQAAREVLEIEILGPGVCGLVPPMMMVGDGAKAFCAGRGVKMVDENELVTEASLQRFHNHRNLLLAEVERSSPLGQSQSYLQDTVGAVAMDGRGNVAACVSSGGISLKQPGRIGEAAMYGAGTWAETLGSVTIGCSVSGTGEQIMKTLFARECAKQCLREADPENALQHVINEFVTCTLIKGANRNVGIILVRSEQLGPESARSHSTELFWAHTTETFCVGWMSSKDGKPHARISTLKSGGKFIIQGLSI
ncbi:nucleophile aminohydrolase [Phlyctochytrium arcticum]|nr:nucleophile aminohydrolase [Phlyctochytrium arcticum]